MNRKSQLQSLLDHPYERSPDKIAIRTHDSEVSYRGLRDQISSVAQGLVREGIGKGDRVAWFLPNGLEAVLTTLACYQIGAVAVPMNYRYVAEEAQDILERTRASLLVYHVERDEMVGPICESMQHLKSFQVGPSNGGRPRFESFLSHAPLADVTLVEPDHPALILFTSGSTGRPKGVVHSHDGASCSIDVSRRLFDFNERDIVLVGKPISHAGGMQTQMMPTLQAGGEVVLVMRPAPEEAVRLINDYHVTQYGMLASDLLDFIEYLETHPAKLPSLRNSIGSGDSVPADLHQRFCDLLGWEVMEGAGMTEIAGYYAANPRYGKRKWGSLGLATPGTELRVVDTDGNSCANEQPGEIIIRCASATTGYWEDPEATSELFRDGWLHTGDLAYRDSDDYVWFVGRRKLMIVRRGSNIAPAEVEDVIDQHPLVHASVVVGVADRRDGAVPVACVALVDRKTRIGAEEKIRQYVAKHLAAYKNPDHYLFVDEMPRTGTGKFDRHHLQELAEGAFAIDEDNPP